MVISSATSSLLNVVRGVSSVAVVVGHCVSYGNLAPALMPPHVPWIQEVAVVAFFWMSGFLVASALDRVVQKGLGAREFIVARAVRIFLPLWPALILTWLIDAATHEPLYASNSNTSTFIGNALALHAVPLAGIAPFGSNRPLWTVAIEWWLYVLAAVAVFRPRHPILWLVGAIAVIVVVENLTVGRGSGLSLVWGLGAAGWIAYRSPRVGERVLAPGLVIVATAAWRWLDVVDAYDWGAQILFGVGASMCAVAFRSRSVSPTLKKGADWLALPAYSLYLVHYPIMLAMGQPIDTTDIGMCLLVSLGVASVFVAVFEMPRHVVQQRILSILRMTR